MAGHAGNKQAQAGLAATVETKARAGLRGHGSMNSELRSRRLRESSGSRLFTETHARISSGAPESVTPP